MKTKTRRRRKSRVKTRPEGAYTRLVAACEKLLADWDKRNLTDAVRAIAAAVAEIKNP
jgi:hypothetical protein